MNSPDILFRALGLDGSDMNQNAAPPAQVIEGAERLNVRRDFSVDGLEEKLMRGSGSFFFAPEFVSELGTDSNLLTHSRFMLREDWAEGRERSAQGVFFGELTLGTDGDSETTIGVACKPYPVLQRHRAVHEYTAMRHFAKRAVPQAYEPLGFWVTEAGHVVLLSRFEQPVESFDNIRWRVPKQPTLWEESDVVSALKKAARILGLLHAQGFVHKDAQVKNMAMDIITQEVRLIDLTTMRLVHTPEKPNLKAWSNGIKVDLLQLIGTVLESMPARVPKGDRREIMELGFLSMHACLLSHPAARARLPEGAPMALKKAYSGVADYFETQSKYSKPRAIDILLSATLS